MIIFLSDAYSDSAENCFGSTPHHIRFQKTKVSDSSDGQLTRMECLSKVKKYGGYPDAAILDENYGIFGNCFSGKRRDALIVVDDGGISPIQEGVEVCEITSKYIITQFFLYFRLYDIILKNIYHFRQSIYYYRAAEIHCVPEKCDL